MKLDFLIPGSPNDGFFSQIAFFRLALDALGGMYRRARLVAVFGDVTVTGLPAVWAPYYHNIDVVWAAPEDFKRLSYLAQGDRRFEVYRPDADLVILCDADTVIMRSFTWLAARLRLKPALGGVLAHYHFPWSSSTGDAARDWNIISKLVIGKEIATPYRYSLDQIKPAPFYVNYGVFIAPPKLMSKFHSRYREILPRVHEIIGNVFSGQVTISLTVHDLGLPTLALPMRFNFPNDRLADNMYPTEMNSIVFMHYLREGTFNRQKIFSCEVEMNKFLGLELAGSDRLFQKFVTKLTDGHYPFPRN